MDNKKNRSTFKLPNKVNLESIYREGNKVDDPIRQEYVDFIDRGNWKYHLTVTFTFPTTEHDAKSLLSELLHRLNKSIYGKSYTKEHNYLEGIVIMEESARFNGVHFHCLIQNHIHIPDKMKFRDMIHQKVSGLVEFRKSGRIDDFKLDAYQRRVDESLGKYLTKDYEHIHNKDLLHDRMGFLAPKKVEFGGLYSISKYNYDYVG